MADAYQTEADIDRYLLEDGSGVYLLEAPADIVHRLMLMGVGRTWWIPLFMGLQY